MKDRGTGSLPPFKVSEWKTWVALAALFVAPPATGTAVLTVKLDGLQAAVSKNTGASEANTKAVNEIKLTMQERKVTERRIGSLEQLAADHEQRLRAMNERHSDHKASSGHKVLLDRFNRLEDRITKGR